MYRLSLWNILVSRSCQWSRGSALQVSATVILALSTFSPANAFRETVDQAEHGKALQCRPCYRCPSDGIFPILIGLFGGMTLHLLDLLKSFHRVVCVSSAGDDVGSGRPSDWTSWSRQGLPRTREGIEQLHESLPSLSVSLDSLQSRSTVTRFVRVPSANVIK